MPIIVTSSGSPESPNHQKGYPGTPENNVFIISPQSKGFPSVNHVEEMQGGSDTFYLNRDVRPGEERLPTWTAGGGSPNIYGYNFETDRIFLPKGVNLEDIIIIRAVERRGGEARIRHDPYGVYKRIFPADDSYFEMIWMEGNVYISGAVNYDSQNNPIGHPVAIRAIERQRSDPEGYDLSRKNLTKRTQAISEEEFLEGTDDLGDIYFSTESSGKISDFMKTIFDHNEKSLFEYAYSENDNAEQDGDDETSKKSEMGIDKPSRYKIKFVDKIINFNSFTDTLEIDTDSFGIDSSATFAAGKNKKIVKKKLAKQDFDFLYEQKKGGLYFNENGSEKGFGDGGIIAILKGAPHLTLGNLEFI